jgi:translation initiation factor 1
VADGRLVYSTESGDHRRDVRGRKTSPTEATPAGPRLPDDGVVRIFREKGGRGGKVVTVIRGLPAADLATVASELKKLCGSGGSAKSDAVEIQGDHREKVAARLQARGYRVKLAGG